MNKAQERALQKVKDYLQKDCGLSGHHVITKFEVEEVQRMKYDKKSPTLESPASMIYIKADLDVPAEIKNNNYLHDRYFFIIGYQGGIHKAKKYYYDSERDITKFVR